MFAFLLKLIFYIPYRLIFWTKWVGKKKMKPYCGKAFVLTCNHRSGMDGPTMFIMMNRRFAVWVKEEFFKSKFWKWFWSRVGGIPVKAGADLSLIRKTAEVLKSDVPLVIYPQGHRSFNTEEELQIRSGAAMMALRAGVPVIPVVTDRAVRPFRLTKFKVGDAIDTTSFLADGKAAKEGIERLSGVIKSQMEGMLSGFEKKEKLKKWQKTPDIIARGIVIREGKLLAIKRVKAGQTYFVLPGGHIEQGETAKMACEREVLEETGVIVDAFRELYKYHFVDPRLRGSGYQSFFVCSYKSGEPHKTDAEEYTETSRETGTYEPVWLPIDELKQTALRPDCIKRRLLRDYKKKGARLAYPLRLIKGRR
jgi:1-acyl-sn-glycerol-3-phosphate acyltransferase